MFEKLKSVNWQRLSGRLFSSCRKFNVRLTTAFNITTTLHWSVPLTLLLLAMFNLQTLVLLCVGLLSIVPHEYGHALVARRHGFRVRDIVIYPVGGVAIVEPGQQMTAAQELAIAAAGPAVSLALAIFGLLGTAAGLGGLWPWFTVVNLFVALFNLIPAFPMDGGRMLRAGLSMLLGHVKATWAAYYVSVAACLLGGALGVFYMNFNIVLVSIVVLSLARAELRRLQLNQ